MNLSYNVLNIILYQTILYQLPISLYFLLLYYLFSMFPNTIINAFSNTHNMNQKMNQINSMLSKNLSILKKLQDRLNNNIKQYGKIKKNFSDQNAQLNQKCSLNTNISQEQKIIQKLFFKREYKYLLLQKIQMATPLYKDRNFNIHVALYDLQFNLIANKSNFPLQLSIYDASQQVQRIQFTKNGQSILKGNTSVDLKDGQALFEKISIRQVSRRFDKGVINMVIYVKSSPFYKLEDIDYKQIRPLVIKDVIVQAKKIQH